MRCAYTAARMKIVEKIEAFANIIFGEDIPEVLGNFDCTLDKKPS